MDQVLATLFPGDSGNSWLVPGSGSHQPSSTLRSCPLYLHQQGVDLQNLWPLVYAPLVDATEQSFYHSFFFLSKNFITWQELDIICVTETWMSLSPALSLNSCHVTVCILIPCCLPIMGRSSDIFFYQSLTVKGCFPRFQLWKEPFKLAHSSGLLCCGLPPTKVQYNKDFLSDFTDFLAKFMSTQERAPTLDLVLSRDLSVLSLEIMMLCV